MCRTLWMFPMDWESNLELFLCKTLNSSMTGLKALAAQTFEYQNKKIQVLKIFSQHGHAQHSQHTYKISSETGANSGPIVQNTLNHNKMINSSFKIFLLSNTTI